MNKRYRYFYYIGFIFLGVIFGIILTSRLDIHKKSNADYRSDLLDENFSFAYEKDSTQVINNRGDFQYSIIKINKKVTPSIVNIEAVRKISLEKLKQFHQRGDQDFWEKFRERLNPFRSPKEYRQGASGSGVIVHPDGYILTNTHVVAGASELKVTLFDNRSYPAQVVGVDSLTEVAVIKIDADNLPVATLGNSEDLEVGQWVVAIGNPLELNFTITVGIISAIGRQMRIISNNFGIENFIQTDAVINPGNSGGALVNLNGEVIGVNTAIATRSGYYEGYGFSIPINLAKVIMKDLITKGRVVRAYLGIAMLPMDSKIAKAYGLEKPQGVFVDRILPDGPAGKAGLQAEDIILSIDSIMVNKANQIQSLIAQRKPGQKIQVAVYRNGRKLTIPVVLNERKTSSKQFDSVVDEKEQSTGLGLEVKNLTNDEADELGLKSSDGILVTKVEMFGNAHAAGLFRGAVITEVNNREVNNKREFWKEIDKATSGSIARLLVKSRQTTTHMFLEIP